MPRRVVELEASADDIELAELFSFVVGSFDAAVSIHTSGYGKLGPWTDRERTILESLELPILGDAFRFENSWMKNGVPAEAQIKVEELAQEVAQSLLPHKSQRRV